MAAYANGGPLRHAFAVLMSISPLAAGISE